MPSDAEALLPRRPADHAGQIADETVETAQLNTRAGGKSRRNASACSTSSADGVITPHEIATMIREQRHALEEQRKLLQRMEEMQLRLEHAARTSKMVPRGSIQGVGALLPKVDSPQQSRSFKMRGSKLFSEDESSNLRTGLLQRSATVSSISKPVSRDADCAISANVDPDKSRRRSVHGLVSKIDLAHAHVARSSAGFAERRFSAVIAPVAAAKTKKPPGVVSGPKVVPTTDVSSEGLMRGSLTLEDTLPSRRKPSVRGKHFEGLERLKIQIESGYRMVVTDEQDSDTDSCESLEAGGDDYHRAGGGYGGNRATGAGSAAAAAAAAAAAGGGNHGVSSNEKPSAGQSAAISLTTAGEYSAMDQDSESHIFGEAVKGKRQTSSYDDQALSAIRTSILASGKHFKTVSGDNSFKYKAHGKRAQTWRRRRRHWLRKFNLLARLPVIHPESSLRAKWNLFILGMLLWYSFSIPFSISFSVTPFGIWRVMDICFDIAFGCDILLNFVTGYYSKRQSVQLIVMNHRMIVKNYVTSWLIVDLVAITPFDLIVPLLATGSTNTERSFASLSKLVRLLKLTRLLRLVGLYRYFRYWSERLKPGTLRLGSSIVVMLLVIHLLACFFYYISDLDPTRVDTWSNEYGVRNEDLAYPKYIASLYWSITTMTTVGYGDIVPQNEGEILFVIVAMLISCSMFAYSVGNVASMVSAIDSTQTLYKEKMDWLKEYCSQQNLPAELQTRIRAYYSNCWKDLKSFPFSEHAILDDLSPALRREVVLYLNKDMVAKVPFFQGQDDNFICRLILCMTTEVCAPLDMIIRQGEVGKAMYFVRRGLVEVCNADATEIYTTLSDGCYFGEISLLVGGRRTASVRAIFHSSLFRLEQEDLDTMLLDYPSALQKIVQIAATSRYQLTDAEHESLQNRFRVFSSVLGHGGLDADGLPLMPGAGAESFESESEGEDRSEPDDERAAKSSRPHDPGPWARYANDDDDDDEEEDKVDVDGFNTDFFPSAASMKMQPDSRTMTERSLGSLASNRSTQSHVPLGAAVLERAKSMSPKGMVARIPSTPSLPKTDENSGADESTANP